MLWCALADAVPIYPLYALLFADSGLSEGRISALFVVWSLVSLLADVPAGALADRCSRRGALVAGGVLQAAAYALWLALPTFAGFAGGFVLWGLGGSLAGGAFPALVYDGLASAGAEDRYGAVLGRAEAAALAVQVPVAGAASALVVAGGYTLAGLVSVGTCLGAAALAATLPDDRPAAGADPGGRGGPGYLATMAAGLREAAGSPPVRAAVVAVAALTAFDGIEEYFPLLAAGWGVPEGAVPVALLAVPLAGAAGALLGARAVAAPRAAVGCALLAGAAALALAGLAGRPAGVAALAVHYGLWRMALIVADVRLQARIAGGSRATVTAIAGLGGGLSVIALFGAWAAGGLALATVLAVLAALTAPRLMGSAASR